MTEIVYTHWNRIPGKPGFKTINSQSIFGTGDITINGGVPYTGATQSLDMGVFDLKALNVFIGGPTGPRLDNSSGTIRARTNNGLADAPFSAGSGTFSGLLSLTSGPYWNSSAGIVLSGSRSWIEGYTTIGTPDQNGFSFYSGHIMPSASRGLNNRDNQADLGLAVSRFRDGYFGGTVTASQFNWLYLDYVGSPQRSRMMNAGGLGIDLQANEATNPLFRVTYAGTEYPLSVSRSGVSTSSVTVGTFPAISTGPINVKSDGKGDCLILANTSTDFTRFVSGGVYKGLIGQGSVPLVLSSSNVRLMSDSTIAFRNVADNADASMSCANVTANGFVNANSYQIGGSQIFAQYTHAGRSGAHLDVGGAGGYNTIRLGGTFLNANTLIAIGGTDATFPAIKRNGTGIDLRLADDSAFTNLSCGNVGLGTTSPTSPSGWSGPCLHVEGGAGFPSVRMTKAGKEAFFATDGSSYQIRADHRILFVTSSASAIEFWTNGINRMNVSAGGDLSLFRPTTASYGVYACGKNASGYTDWELNEGLAASYGGSLTLRAGDAANTGNVRLEYNQGYPKLTTNQTSFTFSGTGFQTQYTNGYIDFSILNQTYLTLGTPAGALINSRATSQKGLVVQSVSGATAPVIETQDSTGAATLRFHPNMGPSSEATDPYMLDIKSQVNWNTPSAPFMGGGLFAIRNSDGTKMVDIYKVGGAGGDVSFKISNAAGTSWMEFQNAGGSVNFWRGNTRLFTAGGNNVINFENGVGIGAFDQNLDATLTVTNFGATSRRGLLIKGMAGQTGNLIETRDGSNVVLPFAVSAGGDLRAKQPTFFPSSTVTPDVTNGALTFEATSNTQVTVKLRGSDGVVRSSVLTLA